MPVTKTAKRALKSSQNKKAVNQKILSQLEIAVRNARKKSSLKEVGIAFSLADRAVKKRVFHKNKASRIKKQLSKLLVKTNTSSSKKPSKKTSKKHSSKK